MYYFQVYLFCKFSQEKSQNVFKPKQVNKTKNCNYKQNVRRIWKNGFAKKFKLNTLMKFYFHTLKLKKKDVLNVFNFSFFQ